MNRDFLICVAGVGAIPVLTILPVVLMGGALPMTAGVAALQVGLFVALFRRIKRQGQAHILDILNECSSITDERVVKPQLGDKALNDRLIEVLERYHDAHLVAVRARYDQSQFTKNVSNELEPCLADLIQNSHLFNQVSVDEASIQAAQSLQASVNRLLSVVSDIFTLSGLRPVEASAPRTVMLEQLADDLVEIVSEEEQRADAPLVHLLVDPFLPHSVRVDPSLLLQLARNLISYSRSHTERGEINLSIIAQDKAIGVGSFTSIKIRCTDTGQSLSTHEVEELNRDITSSAGSSVGVDSRLGLRAAAQIARSLGGRIEVASVAGEGNVTTALIQLKVEHPSIINEALPTSFGFSSGSRDMFCSIGKMAMFLGIRPVPITNPQLDIRDFPLFIEGVELVEGKYGSLSAMTGKDRMIVMLRHKDIIHRGILIDAGFKRFMMMPLTSVQFARFLQGKDDKVQPSVSLAHSSLAPLRVLVVDDIPTVRLRIQELLASMGHIVSEASDGLELVQRVRKGEVFDLILCDVAMRHLDGGEAVRKIRHLENGSNERFIYAVTAYTDSHESDRLLELGFNGVLKKPIFLESLTDILEQADEIRRTRCQKFTTVIDLEDLKSRSAGNLKLMAKVLLSFIEVSESCLADLKKFSSGTQDRMLIAHSLHALKGLLLEAGAHHIAKTLAETEKRIKDGSSDIQTEVNRVVPLVEKAQEAARGVVDQL